MESYDKPKMSFLTCSVEASLDLIDIQYATATTRFQTVRLTTYNNFSREIWLNNMLDSNSRSHNYLRIPIVSAKKFSD